MARVISLQIEMLGQICNLKLNSHLSIGEILEHAKTCLTDYKDVQLTECISLIYYAMHKLQDNCGYHGIRLEHIMNLLDLSHRLEKESFLLKK